MPESITFIIDENITPDAVGIFKEAGLIAHHVNELKRHSRQRITDDQIRKLNLQKGYVLVTKDDDFVHSFVNRKVPDKLIFLYGMDSKDILITRLSSLVAKVPDLISQHDFIEVNPGEVKFPFSD